MKVLVTYMSNTGNTKKVAEAIAEGIESSGKVECKIAKTGEIHTDEICDYDMILFGCPNHNQAPALNMMKFLERASIVHVKGKVGGVFDTYTGGNKGLAVKKLAKVVEEKFEGIRLVSPGFSAKVESRKGPLAESEMDNAKEFGAGLVQEM